MQCPFSLPPGGTKTFDVCSCPVFTKHNESHEANASPRGSISKVYKCIAAFGIFQSLVNRIQRIDNDIINTVKLGVSSHTFNTTFSGQGFPSSSLNKSELKNMRFLLYFASHTLILFCVSYMHFPTGIHSAFTIDYVF